MSKISTMQKLFGLSLLLSLFTVGVGVFSVRELSNISDDVDELYSVHMRGLDIARSINISVLRIVRDEKNNTLIFIEDTPESRLQALDKGYTAFSTTSFAYEPEKGKPEPRSGFTSLDQSTAKLRWTVLLVMPPI